MKIITKKRLVEKLADEYNTKYWLNIYDILKSHGIEPNDENKQVVLDQFSNECLGNEDSAFKQLNFGKRVKKWKYVFVTFFNKILTYFALK